MTQNIFSWSNQTWLCLDQTGILLGNIFMLTTIIGVIWAWWQRDDIHRWLRRNRFPDVGGEFEEQDMHWDGIVFTVSHFEVPKWVMTQYKPAKIALIVTEQSREAATSIEDLAKTLNIQVCDVRSVDADNPKESQAAVTHVLKSMREQGMKHMAVDVTGGKVPMSLGAFMAAEESHVDSIYVTANFDKALKKLNLTTARLCRISEA